ncbi:MAG: hypothetical protein FWG80_01800 [Alphaproteobacteria bacterium]|nr:hypothetical protein [Alphaproteobacteria bacterium]
MRRELGRITRNLALRGGTFYYRTEVKQNDGRYRSFRLSLRTSDFATAIDRLSQVKGRKMGENSDFANLSNEELFDLWCKNKAKADVAVKPGYPDSVMVRQSVEKEALTNILFINLEFNKRSKTDETIKEQFVEVGEHFRKSKKYIDWEDYQMRHTGVGIGHTLPAIAHQQPEPALKHTIMDVMESMLIRGKAKALDTKKAKRNAIKKMIEDAGFKMDDEYSRINNREAIAKINKAVLDRKNTETIQNDRLIVILGFLEELIKHANEIDDRYECKKLLFEITPPAETPDSERKGFQDFEDEHLKKIFDPKHKFFTYHPELFMACIIASFAGSRTNASITLQYKDICDVDGLDYINFREDSNAPKKKLKTNASARPFPIPKQLLDFGTVDLIKKRQEKLGKLPEDFIFECAVKYADPSKNALRPFSKFLVEIGIKKDPSDRRYSFHSFRDTISNKMDDLDIKDAAVNKLIGWEAKSVREKFYLKKKLEKLKIEADKVVYAEDILHLEYWKPIIHDLFLNPDKVEKTLRKKKDK